MSSSTFSQILSRSSLVAEVLTCQLVSMATLTTTLESFGSVMLRSLDEMRSRPIILLRSARWFSPS
jgi:hypothetical protein